MNLIRQLLKEASTYQIQTALALLAVISCSGLAVIHAGRFYSARREMNKNPTLQLHQSSLDELYYVAKYLLLSLGVVAMVFLNPDWFT